jgi:hypothetical protein
MVILICRKLWDEFHRSKGRSVFISINLFWLNETSRHRWWWWLFRPWPVLIFFNVDVVLVNLFLEFRVLNLDEYRTVFLQLVMVTGLHDGVQLVEGNLVADLV